MNRLTALEKDSIYQDVKDDLDKNLQSHLVCDDEGLSLFAEFLWDRISPHMMDFFVSQWLKTKEGNEWYAEKLNELYREEINGGPEHDD